MKIATILGVFAALMCAGSTVFGQEHESEIAPPIHEKSTQLGKPTPSRPILSTKPQEDVPVSRFATAQHSHATGAIHSKSVRWASDAAGHRRLFLEEPLLERQGVMRPVKAQFLESGFRFFSKGSLVPFQLFRKKNR